MAWSPKERSLYRRQGPETTRPRALPEAAELRLKRLRLGDRSFQANGAAGGAAAECDSWRPAAGWSVERRDRVA